MARDRVYGDLIDLNTSSSNIGQSALVKGSSATYNPRQQGVFALHPTMTPKYARNHELRDAEYRDTLARLYISLADSAETTRNAYLESLPSNVKELGKVLLGANSQGGTGFVDFFLTNVQESFQEIVQVDKVLADDYVAFYYGQQPPVFTYSGMLLNSMQDDQRSGFARAYHAMLRGTQLARRGALARLRYDSVIVSGTMQAMTQQLNSENELAVPFSFQFLVKEYVILDNPRFNRKTAREWVQVTADSEVAKLAGVGRAVDTRVRTTTVIPPTQNAVSTAGATEPGFVVQSNNALTTFVGMVTSSATQNQSTSTNVRGVIDPVAPTPPSLP
jgi:hypothetical protein